MPFSLSDSVEVFAPCKGGTGSGQTLEKGFCTPGAEADTELVFPTLFLAKKKKKYYLRLLLQRLHGGVTNMKNTKVVEGDLTVFKAL